MKIILFMRYIFEYNPTHNYKHLTFFYVFFNFEININFLDVMGLNVKYMHFYYLIQQILNIIKFAVFSKILIKILIN